jgi:VCBS repeat-containing protein
VKRGVDFVMSGRVLPSPAVGESLSLMLNDGSSQHKSISVDQTGTFSITVNEAKPGIKQYQLNATSSDKFLSSSSDFVTVVVR